MRKPLFLILVAALIIAGAFLPKITGAVLDISTNEKSDSAPMQSLELAFSKDNQREPRYMLRRLALEQNKLAVPIAPDQAAMTEDEVYAAVEEGMEAYVDANVFEWFEVTSRGAEPYLAVDFDKKSNNAIVWDVTYSSDSEPYHYLILSIDDETGKIIFINYDTNGDDKYRYYDPEDQYLMMEGLVGAFLSPLDLTSYESLTGTEVSEVNTTDEVTAVQYSFHDADYGDITVQFHIYPNGFFTYFSG